MIDVDALKARINLAEVVGHYVPLVKVGREYRGRCVWHSPDENPSMWVVPEKGFVTCFACGGSGDAIAFVQHVEGCDFQKACELLGGTDEWKPSISNPPKAQRPNRITSKPPADAGKPDMTMRGLEGPLGDWTYRDTDGAVLGYVARYKDSQGKTYRPWTWGAIGDDPPEWGSTIWNNPRPLYNLDELAARPTTPVIVVEGEKAADAGSRLLPAYVVTTWPGGAKAWDRVGWKPLAGRKVLLWPDADEPGVEAMRYVADMLANPANLGCNVRVIDTTGLAPGHDLADLEAMGWTTKELIDWAKPRARDWRPETPPDAPQATEAGADLPPADATYDDRHATEAHEPQVRPRKKRAHLTLVGGSAEAAPALDEEALPLELSESGLADEFATTYQADMRFVSEWRRAGWLIWAGQRWLREPSRNTAMQRARSLCHGLKYRAAAAALPPASKNRLESKQYAGNVLDFAEFDKRLIAKPNQWDADPFLLGTPAGTVDLRTGDVLPPLPEQWITRQTAVAPVAGPTPLFDSVIGQAADGDAAMLAYLWRWCGYILTGSTREESFLFLYGPPACGKTTMIEALAAIMGDAHKGGYSVKTNMDLFVETRYERGSGRFHVLQGARFAHAAETEEGRHWKPAMVKECTGGDTLIGERKYENEFSFTPTHKILIHGNHRPHMRQADLGLRRRMQIVEYHAAVDEAARDPLLKQKLIAEYPAILFRMVEGCIDWQRNGLNPPAAIGAAIESYYESEDSFGAWVDERIEVDPLSRVTSGEAYQSYRSWLEERGEHAPSHKRFAMMMQSRGYTIKKSGQRYFDGLRLRPFAFSTMPPRDDFA